MPIPFCPNCGALWPPGAAFCPHCDHVPTRRLGGGSLDGSLDGPVRSPGSAGWSFIGLSAAGRWAVAALAALLAVAALAAASVYILEQITAACNKITSGI